MNKEQLAKLLNGREYGSEITSGEEKLARKAGLVVIYGYSDDNAEFSGAIHDERGCFDGGTLFVHSRGVLPEHDDCDCEFCGFKDKQNKCAKVEAVFGQDGYSWIYETAVPHATFEIVEDGERYCRGIVIDSRDLPVL